MSAGGSGGSGLRYQPDERPPAALTLGLGVQTAVLTLEEGDGSVLESVVASRDENIQDRLALLGDEPGKPSTEEEVSLRMLRRLAFSVRHQQYRGMDVVTDRVAASASAGGGET